MDELAEASLALDDHVGDLELLAEGREPDDDLNGVNVMGDDNELRPVGGISGLDESGDVVDSVLDEVRLLLLDLREEGRTKGGNSLYI